MNAALLNTTSERGLMLLVAAAHFGDRAGDGALDAGDRAFKGTLQEGPEGAVQGTISTKLLWHLDFFFKKP